MGNVANKIEAKDYSIRDVLDNKKYTIDYFQREYKWQKNHIEQLVADLEAAFFNNYKPEHERREVSNYNSYYLGPIVLSEKDGKKSVIDGQQRLTSLTVLLLYLNNLQKGRDKKVNIDSLIYSEKYDEKSFNLDVPERKHCLDALFQDGEYEVKDSDDESIKNITERYEDVANAFPEELKGEALPYFMDWLVDNVVLVVITAYSDDNAYTIFETMNDRGLNLTPSEMLKGYVLSKVKSDSSKRTAINDIWKKEIKKLHEYNTDEDLRFFQSWFRAKYAITIRPGKVGSANEDFEKVGTRFHTWVKDNQEKLGLYTSSNFFEFVDAKFTFYTKLYRKIMDAQITLTKGLEHLHYANMWGFASSLADPLYMAPIRLEDSEEAIYQKLNMVGRYIETFSVRRSVNFRTFSQSSIRYTMYNLVLEIRDKSVEELGIVLREKLESMEEKLSGVQNFHMHGQNKYFVKFFLSRITSHVEQSSGRNTSFSTYFNPSEGKPYEIEHIWANRIEYHTDEITQTEEFRHVRDMIGDLLLLQRGTNQSFSDASYEDKLPHYLKENLLAQSLHEACYQKNPNFRAYIAASGLPFKPHDQFKRKDIEERQELYQKIAEDVWGLDFFSANQVTTTQQTATWLS
ncbi:uncharacterized protein with ParB-like and HNH nuclease domain [Pontibacter ummariensis]|uniref:Uncharacterized conserved protein, contains ParB-like and HNH nuclease domains n=1 Tax=Pontibacter ummariensis TaxID=1610492 RepID=A0A239FYX5_9BACT|nr:DUF262 domain-containing protein [Pontibacter ummariensis]PRY11901.1 uncharacterized protein with ParB-like and HNH nuclease domain [Pontibacter ummariensis]SNS60974.1 Uncharacterized conserved protein, contains ParB-like and HNH nuclease domains [Pontibacter ummariensis]